MKKSILARTLSMALALLLLASCGTAPASSTAGAGGTPAAGESATGSAPAQSTGTGERKEIQLWFWAAAPYLQEIMREGFQDKINAMQDDYELVITFNDGNANNIATALAANSGPDIVFTSGPSWVSGYAAAGKLENMNAYSEKYGWEDRMIKGIYDVGTYDGDFYAVSTSLLVMGVFYNKKVLADNGWEVPETIEEMEEIMDEAIAKGLYGSVTGCKAWKPVNANYYSLFMSHIGGPDNVKACLTGETPFNNPDMVAAINKSAEWYQKGYLGGDNYNDLNFEESIQLLAMGQSPFFVGPSLAFQWTTNYFTGDAADDLGFIPFPKTNDQVPYPNYVLGVTGCFSINAFSEYKDECAEIIDYVLTNDFMVTMTQQWPGYWAVPLKEYDIPEGSMDGISALFCDVIADAQDAIEEGHYGYYGNTYFPPATDVALQDVDGVWLGTMTAEELLANADAEYAKDVEGGLVVPIE